MEPENDGFQKESPFSRDFFSGSMLNFRGVYGKSILSRDAVKTRQVYLLVAAGLRGRVKLLTGGVQVSTMESATGTWV